jgi:hypothetical protein
MPPNCGRLVCPRSPLAHSCPCGGAGAIAKLVHEGGPLNVIQRQLGHTNLGVTSIYLQGIDNAEIIATLHARNAPMVPASTGAGEPPVRRPDSRRTGASLVSPARYLGPAFSAAAMAMSWPTPGLS